MSEKLTPIHPGEVLMEDYLTPLGLRIDSLAVDLGLPAGRFTRLVQGRCAVRPDTAVRLARYFDTSPEFWLNLQSRFEFDLTEDAAVGNIRRNTRPREPK